VAPTTTRPTVATTTITTTTPSPAPASRAATAAACPDNLADDLAAVGASTQLMTVEASSYSSEDVTVTLWQRDGPCWAAVAGPWSGLIGARGFSDHHVEGDNTTPTGIYTFEPVIYGNAPDPGVRFSYHQLVCGDWWDEDPTSPEYNTFQHVPCGTNPPFGAGSEALWTETVAYPSFAVVNYNTGPVVPDAGSGIFVHANIGAPTEGCVSLPLGELDQFLQWLNPADSPQIVMGPAAEIDRF
jgi:L,D-peptidoglycan transpeptidase YkuD (ErfK/YbiS/YcfS/YnhG family)